MSDSVSKNNINTKSEEKVEGDDDEEMQEQLEEYRELLEELGNHADKVTINLLTMVAEDNASDLRSASSLYNCIRELLISPTIHPERKLPLVYVIDSILKNVKQHFISLIEIDALTWIPVVYTTLDKHPNTKAQKVKLRKVIQTWKDFQVFQLESVQKMITCYEDVEANSTVNKIDSVKVGVNNGADASSIPGTGGGAGVLEGVSGALRAKMQDLLDEIHSDVDELEKVSLERLAAINPNLLENIKKIAMGELGDSSNAETEDSQRYDFPHENSFFSNHVSKEHLQRSQDWMKVGYSKSKAGDLVSQLQHHVMTGSKLLIANSTSTALSPTNTINNPSLIAAASVTANHISVMLQFLQDNDPATKNNDSFQYPFFSGAMGAGNGLSNNNTGGDQRNIKLQTLSHNAHSRSNANLIDKSLFTTEGIATKTKQHARIVSMLYEEGLPFLSTSDGRRFKTQIDLSKHLDELFRKSQLEKTMERTEERGWNISSLQWSGIPLDPSTSSSNISNLNTSDNVDVNNLNDAQLTSVHADENRSKCVICGNPFEMYFDQEVGDHMYKNCREIELLNDEAAEEESELTLVHIRCLQGLGSPEFLTMDQVLQV